MGHDGREAVVPQPRRGPTTPMRQDRHLLLLPNYCMNVPVRDKLIAVTTSIVDDDSSQ